MINFSNITQDEIDKIPLNKFEYITISSNKNITRIPDISKFVKCYDCPNLIEIRAKATDVFKCPKLEYVNFFRAYKTDNFIPSSITNITHLEISNSKITEIPSYPNLINLSLIGCPNLEKIGKMKSLERLTYLKCKKVKLNFPNLTDIIIDCDFDDEFDYLESIYYSNCKELKNVHDAEYITFDNCDEYPMKPSTKFIIMNAKNEVKLNVPYFAYTYYDEVTYKNYGLDEVVNPCSIKYYN